MEFKKNILVYVQLADYYQKLIELGVYPKDSYLPSIRNVAADEDLNPNTVVHAFRLLEERGCIRGIGKKGYIVIGRGQEDSRINHLYESISLLFEEKYSLDEIISAYKKVEEDNKVKEEKKEDDQNH